MTILILFQQSGYRTFKGFYTQHVQTRLRAEFPQLVSYVRFVASVIGTQLAPPEVEFQTPPSADPIQISLLFCGFTATLVMRPLLFCCQQQVE
jgi:hypothetical protein